MKRRQKIMGGLFIVVSFLVLIGLGFPMLANQTTQPISAQKELLMPINFLQKPYPKVALLYFGVVGCKTICGPTIQEIDGVYYEQYQRDHTKTRKRRTGTKLLHV